MIVIRSAGASSLARPGLHGPEQWPDRDRIVAGIGRYSGQRGLDPHLWRGKEGCCSTWGHGATGGVPVRSWDPAGQHPGRFPISTAGRSSGARRATVVPAPPFSDRACLHAPSVVVSSDSIPTEKKSFLGNHTGLLLLVAQIRCTVWLPVWFLPSPYSYYSIGSSLHGRMPSR
jgi:hypothetical protein